MLFPFGTAKVGGEFGKKLEEEAFPRFFFKPGRGTHEVHVRRDAGGEAGKNGEKHVFPQDKAPQICKR